SALRPAGPVAILFAVDRPLHEIAGDVDDRSLFEVELVEQARSCRLRTAEGEEVIVSARVVRAEENAGPAASPNGLPHAVDAARRVRRRFVSPNPAISACSAEHELE